ncbi:MAG TPA: hypothetical protein VIM73_22490 [Polyangiaceae bacterium]
MTPADIHGESSGGARRASASSGRTSGERGARGRTTEEVQALLDRFARALTAGDGEAAADLWEAPAFVIGDTGTHPVGSRDEVVQFFSGAREQYNSLGIIETRAEIVDLEWISDNLLVVRVRWPHLDAQGRERGEESSSYTMMRDANGALKIRVVLMRGAKSSAP